LPLRQWLRAGRCRRWPRSRLSWPRPCRSWAVKTTLLWYLWTSASSYPFGCRRVISSQRRLVLSPGARAAPPDTRRLVSTSSWLPSLHPLSAAVCTKSLTRIGPDYRGSDRSDSLTFAPRLSAIGGESRPMRRSPFRSISLLRSLPLRDVREPKNLHSKTPRPTRSTAARDRAAL